MAKVIIGIDPGLSGAISWKDCKGVRHVVNMPETPKDILDQIRLICSDTDEQGDLVCACSDVVCYIEDVGKGMPGQSSKATATFARHCGHLEAFLLAEAIRTVKILPQKWERTMGIGSSKDLEKADWKRKLKAKAQELYPDKKVTLKNCDALLILEYAVTHERP